MKQTIELNEECSRMIEQISKHTKHDAKTIVEDVVQTFCGMPYIVLSDLDEFCIKQIEECDKNDAHRKSSFTVERLKRYQRIQFLIEVLYKSQIEEINRLKESKE